MRILIHLVLVFSWFTPDSSARQRVIIPGSYSRQLQGIEHTWSFKGNVVGVRYKDGTPVTLPEVRSFIENALHQWSDAANQEGERIRFAESGDHFAAELRIEFVGYNGWLGMSGPGFLWIADSGHAWPARLQTTILHEMGHVFLGSGHNGDGVMSQSIGSGHPSVICTSVGQLERQWILELYNPKIRFQVGNIFGDGSGGGEILLDGTRWSIPPSPGFIEIDSSRASTFPRMLVAVNRQKISGYEQEFDCWNGDLFCRDLSLGIDTTQGKRYVARFRNVYELSLANDFGGSGNGGFIKLGAIVYTLPTSAVEILHGATAIVEAPAQSHGALVYEFSNWSDGNTTNPLTFQPLHHVSLTARYKAVKALPPPGFDVVRRDGEPVRLSWTEHPSSTVTQYRVWRRIEKQSGRHFPAECVASMDRGTTSWTDSRYKFLSQNTGDLVSYGVQSFHAATATFSEIEFVTFFAKPAPEGVTGLPGAQLGRIPADYSISHFSLPDRFSFQIVCALPDESAVRLDLYDVAGRRITTLLNERRPPGFVTVTWNGRDEWGNRVSAGVYFYRLQATSAPSRMPASVDLADKIIVVR